MQVQIFDLYEGPGSSGNKEGSGSPIHAIAALDELLGRGPAGMHQLMGCNPRGVAILTAGLEPSLGAELTKRLGKSGIHGGDILVAGNPAHLNY